MPLFIHFRVDKYENDIITHNAKALKLTKGEYLLKCHAEYCKINKIVIDKATKLKLLRIENKDIRRNFYFFKNALQALFMEIEWQLRLKNGTYDAERALIIIDGFLKEYELLPDYVKKLLSKEHKEFMHLADPKYLQNHVERMRPPVERKLQIGIKAKI